MTLFTTFYNSFDLPLKPVATFGIFCCKHLDSFLNLLLQLLMCFLNFVFSLNLKWHCSHFNLHLKPQASFLIFGLIFSLVVVISHVCTKVFVV